METLLYYPYVNPPKVVLWQALLYWDNLSSIVPPGYEPQRHVSSRRSFVPQLADAGIYAPVYLNECALDIESVRYEIETLFRSFGVRQLVGGRPASRLEQTFLYYGKVPAAVEQWLLEAGVVEAGRSAMYGPKALLHPIIAVLARHAAAQLSGPHHSYLLHTDSESAAFAAFAPLPEPRLASSAGLRLELGRVLPVPSPNTDFEDVLRFREHHHDERVRCRVALWRLAHSLDRADHDVAIDSVALELADATRELRRAGRARGISWVKRGLAMLVTTGAAISESVWVGEPMLAPYLATLGALGISVVTQGGRRPISPDAARFSFVHELEQTFREVHPPQSW